MVCRLGALFFEDEVDFEVDFVDGVGCIPVGGMSNVVPTESRLGFDILFVVCMTWMLVPCLEAMLESVSPRLTV